MPPDPFSGAQDDWSQWQPGSTASTPRRLGCRIHRGAGAMHLTPQYLTTLLSVMLAGMQQPGA